MNKINLEDLMGPDLSTRGGFPGPTLIDLKRSGFQRIGFYAVKRNVDGDVLEAYKIVEGKPYYARSTPEEFETYFRERMADIRIKLKR